MIFKTVATVLLAILSLAAATFADDRVLIAEGTTLSALTVRFNKAAVKRDTRQAMEQSYAQLMRDQAAISKLFRTMFRRQHLTILSRYYAPSFLKRQKATYAALAKTEAARSGIPPYKLECVERDGQWWVDAMLLELAGKQERRFVSAPRRPPPVSWPKSAVAKADAKTPDGTLALLQQEMRRLRADRMKARAAYDAVFFEMVATFFGKQAVKRTRAEQVTEPAPFIPRFALRPSPVDSAPDRYVLSISEEVPGSDGKFSAIGAFAFALERDGARWRVTAEAQRRRAEGPFADVTQNFGLVFLLR